MLEKITNKLYRELNKLCECEIKGEDIIIEGKSVVRVAKWSRDRDLDKDFMDRVTMKGRGYKYVNIYTYCPCGEPIFNKDCYIFTEDIDPTFAKGLLQTL